LLGALLDGKFVVAADERECWRFRGGHFIRLRCQSR
jgi:hypothetical protein